MYGRLFLKAKKSNFEKTNPLKKSSFLIPTLLVAGAIGYFAYQKMQLGTRTKLFFKKLNLAGKGLNKKLQIIFQLINPTSTTGTIDAIDGEVYINNQKVADFFNFSKQTIPARSESEVRVNTKFTTGIISLLTTKDIFKSGIQYIVQGTVTIDGIPAPFQFNGRI